MGVAGMNHVVDRREAGELCQGGVVSRFDVVVVGAGSAGAVLAARLASPVRSVLLLDAGPGAPGERSPEGLVGSDFFGAAQVPGRTWPGTTASRSRGAAPTPYLHGRGLGGSSAINGMVADLGIPEDYDDWVAAGAPGWGWTDLAPWFGRTRLAMHQASDAEMGPLGTDLISAMPGRARRVLLTRDAAGRRVSTGEAYLSTPQPGLTARSEATVVTLIIHGRHVAGVRLDDGSEIEAAEVVVAGGAIESPLLLLRSGIDTPGIGENLSDHPGFGIVVRNGAGPVGDRRPAIAAGARLTSGEEPADLQLLALEHSGGEGPGSAMLLVGLMKTYSRGTVRLGASGAADIDLDMLDDERDVRRLHSGVDQAYALLQRAPLSAWVPSTERPASADDLRAGLGGYYHAAGTCALGTVLDPACRVRGYERLRVCDASIMPSLPRAGPHLSIVAMAERLAAMIAGETS